MGSCAFITSVTVEALFSVRIYGVDSTNIFTYLHICFLFLSSTFGVLERLGFVNSCYLC